MAAHRLFVDLAARLSLVWLVSLGDAILQKGLANEDELRDAVGWARRRPGVVAARRALTLLDGRSRSTGETRLRLVLVLSGLPAPACNIAVQDSVGGWLAESDLVYEEWRIVYEYDGAHHFADPRQRRRDVGLNEALRDEDWIVLVITSLDERRPQRILDRTTRALLRRGIEPPPGVLSAVPYLNACRPPPPLRRG